MTRNAENCKIVLNRTEKLKNWKKLAVEAIYGCKLIKETLHSVQTQVDLLL